MLSERPRYAAGSFFMPGDKRQRLLICLFAALAVAAGVRFADLGQKPLWCDELATLQRLSLPLAEHLRAMQGNHPLYEILLRFWMPPDGSDAWMRIPSAVLGVLAVWMTWLLARRAGPFAGLTATWLMALSPLHLMYSRIARPYSLSCTLALASTLALIWALKRRRFLPFFLYALAAAAMVGSNLVAASLALGQGIFLLWFFRRRPSRLAPWVAAFLAIGLLLAPWMLPNARGAVAWGSETTYTARQFGLAAKACYLPMTFCLGETVNPLNLWVVIPAFLVFGIAGVYGAVRTIRSRRAACAVPARRGVACYAPTTACAFGVTAYAPGFRRPMMLFLLLQIAAVYGFGLCFSAAAPKHLLVIVPAWLTFLAISLGAMRKRRVAVTLAGVMLIVSAVSLFNYFTNRQFADADMVTPWRQIAGVIERGAAPGDPVLIGYRPDRGVYDIFHRYYRGRPLHSEHVDFGDWQRQFADALRTHRTVWLLLHDGDPWQEMEAWLCEQGTQFTLLPFQEEEHTLARLRAGWGAGAKEFTSPLYRLYRISSGQSGRERAIDS